MSARLPKIISYMQPIVDELVALDPEEVDEDFDTTELLAAIAHRVAGLPLPAAQRRIQADRNVLLKWLETQGDHPAHFIAAFIEPPEVAEFAAAPSPLQKVKKRIGPLTGVRAVTLELPGQFLVSRQGKSLVFLGPTVGVVLTPMALAQLEAMQASIVALPGTTGGSVVLGPIQGTRYNFAGRVMYFLVVEGQGVQVAVDSGGKAYDVAALEKHLAGIALA